jgi:hypothetical protein
MTDLGLGLLVPRELLSKEGEEPLADDSAKDVRFGGLIVLCILRIFLGFFLMLLATYVESGDGLDDYIRRFLVLFGIGFAFDCFLFLKIGSTLADIVHCNRATRPVQARRRRGHRQAPAPL